MPPVKTAPKPTGLALTAEEAKKLRDDRAKKAAAKAAGARPKLTQEERLIASTLRDRDHLDGCPTIDDPTTGRVEAYGAVKPPDIQRGLPAVPMAVVRCIDCGGQRYFEGLADREALIAKRLDEVLADEGDDALDTTL